MVPILVLLHSILFVSLCDYGVFAVVQQFEAFDRKMFKTRKQRYATFDKRGILTLDGTLNGKSNDITFPNTESSELNQFVCNPEPKLLFEFCETAKYKPWTALAICYESQLQQPYLNPAIRIQPVVEKAELTKLVCGERQSAIFIKRVVPGSVPGKGGKYRPHYTITTSFTGQSIDIKMPEEKWEKKCMVLELGGTNLLNVKVKNLRKEQQPTIYTNRAEVGESFQDWSNRRFQHSMNHSLNYLMLDFLPPFGFVQNISVYGWLPLKIKITGQSIKPCTLDWELLESRTVSGGLTANELQIVYELEIGDQRMLYKMNTTANETGTDQSHTDTYSAGAGIDAGMPMKGGLKGGGGRMIRGGGMMRKGGGGMSKMSFASASIQASLSNTWGSQNSNGQNEGVSEQLSSVWAQTRTETVTFFNFVGTINVEQLVYQCHGTEIRPDKVRYHDLQGNAIMPDSVTSSDVIDNLMNDYYGNGMDLMNGMDDCFDNVAECAIWAGQGECRGKAAFMLTRCKHSCGLCTSVAVHSNAVDSTGGNAQFGNDLSNGLEEDCRDYNSYCATFVAKGLCQRNPLVMSNYCRMSCGLCISVEDAYYRMKEIDAQENDKK